MHSYRFTSDIDKGIYIFHADADFNGAIRVNKNAHKNKARQLQGTIDDFALIQERAILERSIRVVNDNAEFPSFSVPYDVLQSLVSVWLRNEIVREIDELDDKQFWDHYSSRLTISRSNLVTVTIKLDNHGIYGYGRGCRCQECRDGKNTTWKATRARRAKERVEIDGNLVCIQEGIEHGKYTTYLNYSCRCDECRAEYKVARKRWQKPNKGGIKLESTPLQLTGGQRGTRKIDNDTETPP